MGYCNYSLLFERLLTNRHGSDLKISRENGNLEISGRAVEEICVTAIVAINAEKIAFLIPVTFIGEETPDTFVSYVYALRKLKEAGLTAIVVLDDCEYLLVNYVRTLEKLLKLMDPGRSIVAATYLVLLSRYAEITRKYRYRGDISEEEYLEYQWALENVARYLDMLINVVPSMIDVNSLLDMVKEQVSADLKKLFSKVVDSIAGLHLEPRVHLVTELLAECPANLSITVKKLWQLFKESGLEHVYVLVPKHVKGFLKELLSEDAVVGV